MPAPIKQLSPHLQLALKLTAEEHMFLRKTEPSSTNSVISPEATIYCATAYTWLDEAEQDFKRIPIQLQDPFRNIALEPVICQ